jgi:hypothetical protein
MPAPAPQATRGADDDWAASLGSDEPAPVLQPAAVPPPAATPVAPSPAPAQPGLSIDEVRDRWSRIRQTVRATSRRIEALLASADPFQIDAETLTLVAAYDFHRDGLNKDDTRKVIEEVVAQVLGRPYRVRCVNQEEARGLGPAPTPVAPNPPPVAPTVGAVPDPSPAPAPTANLPAPVLSGAADELPPWSEPESAPAPPPVQAVRATETAPAPAPTRPQAHHVRETAIPAASVGVDERYFSALRNLFNAEEIRTEGGEFPRPRQGACVLPGDRDSPRTCSITAQASAPQRSARSSNVVGSARSATSGSPPGTIVRRAIGLPSAVATIASSGVCQRMMNGWPGGACGSSMRAP